MSSARSVTTVLCLVLAVSAIMRLAGAMKEQAALGFRLTHQANHDDLTGLPNRVLVVKHIDAMLSDSRRTGRPVALMFLDLDQFKLVNDSMGHAVGDQLLVLAAERIGNCVRSDDIVGRISGDEFLVVAGGLDADGAAGLADRVRRVLERGVPARRRRGVHLGVDRHRDRVRRGCRRSGDADPGSRHRDVSLEGRRPQRGDRVRHVDAGARRTTGRAGTATPSGARGRSGRRLLPTARPVAERATSSGSRRWRDGRTTSRWSPPRSSSPSPRSPA